jgi:Ser/Thr protein kinase RdoA (MazF antagonist)
LAQGRRHKRELALAAVAEVARRLDLNPAGAIVIAESNNTIVRLPLEELVAKVSTSALEGRGETALERELRLGRRLADRRVPIASPADDGLAGPHQARGSTLTLWRYVAPGEPPDDGDRLLGEAVRSFHAALADIATELPHLTDKIELANRLLQGAAATPRLMPADRRLAERAHDRLVPLVNSLSNSTALHGEPHDGNIVWSADGPVLIDFEAACQGPIEWDLSYLPVGTLSAFPGHHDETIAKLRAGVSFCVAAWCVTNPDPTPAVAEAATVHWNALSRSWLAR